MTRYNGVTLIVETNAPLPAATVAVYDHGTLDLVPLYSDEAGTTPIANPLTSAATTGLFGFYAADGVYDLTITKTGYTSYSLPGVVLSGVALDAAYLLQAASATLPNGLVVTDSDDIVWTYGSGTASAAFASDSARIRVADVTLTHAQILALPTTPVALVAAPAAGWWIRPWGATYTAVIASAYTNLNTSYASLGLALGDPANYDYVGMEIVNDSTWTYTGLTDFLTTVGTLLASIGAPYLLAISAGSSGVHEYVQTSLVTRAAAEATALNLGLDNNSSGDLTGGSAGNALRVRVYYTLEPLP